MKIKHFQGYGTVDAKRKKLSSVKDMFGEEIQRVQITVTGMHEYGLKTYDSYGAVNWFNRYNRLLPEVSTQTKLEKYDVREERGNWSQNTPDRCVYTFFFKAK